MEHNIVLLTYMYASYLVTYIINILYLFRILASSYLSIFTKKYYSDNIFKKLQIS